MAEETRQDAEPEDDLVSSAHTITIDGRELRYTAGTGRVVLRTEVLKDGAFEGHRPQIGRASCRERV